LTFQIQIILNYIKDSKPSKATSASCLSTNRFNLTDITSLRCRSEISTLAESAPVASFRDSEWRKYNFSFSFFLSFFLFFETIKFLNNLSLDRKHKLKLKLIDSPPIQSSLWYRWLLTTWEPKLKDWLNLVQWYDG
jgi:hypothetical protein